jgi:CRP/FNR family transcriptional regulator
MAFESITEVMTATPGDLFFRRRDVTARAGLDDFAFFGRLSPPARTELKALASIKVKAGAHLLERGDTAGGAYLVVSGALRVFYISQAGREATLYRVRSGGTCVLALTSTLGEAPYPAWVDAEEQGSTFVRVPPAMLQHLLDTETSFRQFMFSALSTRITELMLSLEEVGTARIEQRVAKLLLDRRESDGIVRLGQAAIAAELGTAREVVFRALRSLAARGLIDKSRGQVRVLDAERLG